MHKICAECGIDFKGRRSSKFCSAVCYFWSRIDKSGGPDACWMWTGSVNPQTGYGVVDSHAGGGKRTTPHRHAYRLTHGDPGELSVLVATRNDVWSDAHSRAVSDARSLRL